MIIKPFRGIRPVSDMVGKVQSPPYDVVEREKVGEIVSSNRFSFLRITRADAELGDEISEYDSIVYKKARENFLDFVEKGILIADPTPCLYILKQKWEDGERTGIYALVSCVEYNTGKIKKHELTRPEKEKDRTRHIEAVRAQTGPVMLAYKRNERGLEDIVSEVMERKPVYNFEDETGVQNILWILSDSEKVMVVEKYFEGIDSFYIADGHHRAASAYNLWKRYGSGNGISPFDYFLAVLFPADKLCIYPYNRVAKFPSGHSYEDILEGIRRNFYLREAKDLTPERKGEIKVYTKDQLFSIELKKELRNTEDVLKSLDVFVLQEHLFKPVLRIIDLRNSDRVAFVGGKDSEIVLKELVDSGEYDIAFSLYPVSMDDLIKVTDNGYLMPPKSTWFEPKLRDGVVTYSLDL